jgi:hypothetical protein
MSQDNFDFSEAEYKSRNHKRSRSPKDTKEKAKPKIEKEKPNFEPSGILAEF